MKVAVGISGGVDSAVSALLLKRAGYDVVGVHLYCWPPKSEIEKDGVTREEWIKKNGCRADEDRDSALKTALEIGIPFKTLDFSEEYNQKVIKYFYEEYEAGRTPNPDVLCNSEIKFGLFLNWALENGFDAIATGHYAKLNNFESVAYTSLVPDEIVLPAQNFSGTQSAESPVATPAQHTLRNPVTKSTGLDSIKLFVPKDKHKDQTYFLWKLTEKELKHVIFPLGELEKKEVREIAKEAKLSVADKKDSQGICFVGNVEVREFLARRLKVKNGDVVDIDGKKVGTHDGVWFYTIGQRGGWEMDPAVQKEKTKKNDGGDNTPIFYIVDKDAKTNTLTVAEANGAERDIFEVTEVNKISGNWEKVKELYVRIRHGGELIGARIMKNDHGYLVELMKSVRGVASGQSAVFYSADGMCLGGGVIV